MPRIRTFDLEVPGTPAEVAERLGAQTRWRLLPHTSSVLGRGRLGGRVDVRGFSVSTDPAVRLGRRARMLPVARARFEEAGPGRTRIVGSCSLPPALVWYLRLVWLALPALLAWVLWSAVSAGTATLPILVGWLVFVLAVATAGIGFNVAESDALVDEVADAVLAAAGAGSVEVSAAARQAAAARTSEPA